MTMAVGLAVSKIVSQRSKGSVHNEIDYNLLKCSLGPYILFKWNIILNGLPSGRFALSECF